MHIAMVSIPAHGHVNPSLEVIRELTRRGHRLTYANDPSFAQVIADVGAELKPYATTLPGPDAAWPDDPVAAMTIFLDDAISMLPQLRAAYEHDKPDLFLYDIAGAPARLLGWQWGIPAVQLSPTFVAWDGFEDEVEPIGGEYERRCSAWLAANDSPVTNSVAFLGRPDRCVALIPAAMQPNIDRVDRDVYSFAGPIIGERGTWTRPESAENVLLISLGSAFTDHPDFYRRCIRAFGELPGWHTVLQYGRHVDRTDLGEIPASVEALPWVPQTAILAQADAFLTHAGMGGSAEGLWAGTPMLCAPQAADQFGNADRLVELGVARRIDVRESSVADLRSALVDLLSNPRVREKSAALAAEVHASSGAAHAADLCLQGTKFGADAASRLC